MAFIKVGENSENAVQKTLILGNIARRFASYIIDLLVVNVLFLLIINLINQIYTLPSVQSFYNQTVGNNAGNTTMNAIAVEFLFSYLFLLGVYFFLMLLIFSKTLGMMATNLVYVSSNNEGNPVPLSVPQKFLRGFIGEFSSILFIFVPIIVFPFDQYRRSLVDRISGVFVMQKDNEMRRTIIAYIIIFAFIALYTIVNSFIQ